VNDVSGSSWVLVHASHAKEQNFRAREAGGLTWNRRCLFRRGDSSTARRIDDYQSQIIDKGEHKRTVVRYIESFLASS
jgi:hypothetical protein